jgi:RNA polymerase I-specific transcription initiation factor RRN6
MDETGTYGQFGQAIYNHDEKAWEFQRSVKSSPIFQLLTEPKAVVEPGERNAGFEEDGKEGPSRRRENQVKDLIKLYPELQPAGSLLKNLVRTSEAVEESSARYDPVKGILLAFGVVPDKLTKGRTKVIAYPTGPNGNDLHLVQVQTQRRGWSDVRNTYLQVPTLHGEKTIWRGPGIPIQSIVFANPLEGVDNYLAIRLITQILIFRPMLREVPVQGGSCLDMNLSVTLDMNQTGDHPFVDLAFNPWFTRQIAALDQRGRCTVLELVGKPRTGTNQVAQSQPTKDLAGRGPLQDCWGRVSWISGPSTIAVCTRRNLKVFSYAEKDLKELYDLDVGVCDVGWILDMVVTSSHTKHVMIVTSHHVVVYHIDKALASKVAMVRHFRDADDISMRANCFDEGEGKPCLLLV